MMYGVLLVVHVLVAIFLIGVVLLQGGRGSLGEALGGAAAQSLFGGGANVVMTRVTAVCAGLFMVTCLSLASLSTSQGPSVMDQLEQLQQSVPVTPEGQVPSPGAATHVTEPPAPAPSAPTAPASAP